MAKTTDVAALRSKLAQAQSEQDAAHKRFKEAERKTRAAGRDLIAALASDLDLSPTERRAMGLKRASS